MGGSGVKVEYRIVCNQGCAGHIWRKPTMASAAKAAVKLNETWPQLKRNQLGVDRCVPWRVEAREIKDWRPAE